MISLALISTHINYMHNNMFKLIEYTDSDQEGPLDDTMSTMDWFFSLDSAAVAWCSKKQQITTLSNTREECISATSTACEAMWLWHLLEDLNKKQIGPTIIYCDNKSSLSITQNPTMHGRTKNIDTHYHFIRDLVGNDTIDVVHYNTNEQVPDVFTKALSSHKHEYSCDVLGLKGF